MESNHFSILTTFLYLELYYKCNQTTFLYLELYYKWNQTTFLYLELHCNKLY